MKKKLSIAGVIFVLLFIYFTDWSFLKGGITEYGVFCPKDYTEGNGCYTLGTTTYYPNKNKQEVILKSEFGIETLKKCSVIDRKNWECKWNDESATFGFINGQFHNYPEDINEPIGKEHFLNTDYVSRFRWTLEHWNIL